MRGSGLFGLLGAIVTGLIIADLWYHGSVTNTLIHAGTKESSLLAGRG